MAQVAAIGDWDGSAALEVAIGHNDERLGSIILGPRQGGAEYAPEDTEALHSTAALVGEALALAARVNHAGAD
jgi:hypothetical protein